MMYGLKTQTIQGIQEVFKQYPEVEKAILYGSRAKGNYHPGSDIDLTLIGEQLNLTILQKIENEIDELLLPYKIDLSLHKQIQNAELLEHIKRVGKVFFDKNERVQTENPVQDSGSMKEWKEIKLRDISSDISYGYTASASNENVGPKFLRITDITSGRINWETVPYCRISEKDFKKYKLGIGDIVIARTGATTGYNAIIKTNIDAVYASYLIRFQINRKLADPFFVGHILQSNNFQDYVDAIAGGSAQPGANAQQLADFEFLLPPLPEQTAIAEVLSSLDDKIDLLHRQNKTLEQLAETLFRQWFVEEAEESWEVGSLGDVITIYDSKRIPLSSGEREKMKVGQLYPYYGAASIMDYVNNFIFDGEYILMGEDGTVQTPEGYPILQLPTGKFWVNNHAHIFQAKTPYTNFFIYIFLKQTNISGIVTGAVQPKINQEALKGIDFPIPPAEKTNRFIDVTNEFWNKIKSNTQQIRTLTQLRDTLLPKLMSGEVRVSEKLKVESEKLWQSRY